VLKLILDHAIDNGQLFTNAAHGVRVIKSSRIEHKAPVPSKEAIRALIEAADEDFKPHLIVSALGGLRASELRGLRWQDVDFEKGFIHIRQRADAYNQMGEPKSRAGSRHPGRADGAERPAPLETALPEKRVGLVFPAPRGGILQHTRTQDRFRKLQEKVEVTMRWHDLRHFAVSLWIEQGFSIKEVMTFAGHSSIQMTMERYGHLFPSPDHQKAMAMVEAKLLSDSPTEKRPQGALSVVPPTGWKIRDASPRISIATRPAPPDRPRPAPRREARAAARSPR
jgi:integrase